MHGTDGQKMFINRRSLSLVAVDILKQNRLLVHCQPEPSGLQSGSVPLQESVGYRQAIDSLTQARQYLSQIATQKNTLTTLTLYE